MKMKRFDAKLRRLRRIYAAMRRWGGDQESAKRIVQAVDPSAKLLVVAEAVGPRTLRLSGVNYFDTHGRLGATGRYLDRILEHVGYTVYPPREVRLGNGAILPGASDGRKTGYFTDICPVFPGHAGARDRSKRILAPGRKLVGSAVERQFLKQELAIIKPRVILLLGHWAYEAFYTHFLEGQVSPSLSSLVVRIHKAELSEYQGAVVIPFFHPSPANLRFVRWFSSFSRSPKKSTLTRVLQKHLH